MGEIQFVVMEIMSLNIDNTQIQKSRIIRTTTILTHRKERIFFERKFVYESKIFDWDFGKENYVCTYEVHVWISGRLNINGPFSDFQTFKNLVQWSGKNVKLTHLHICSITDGDLVGKNQTRSYWEICAWWSSTFWNIRTSRILWQRKKWLAFQWKATIKVWNFRSKIWWSKTEL